MMRQPPPCASSSAVQVGSELSASEAAEALDFLSTHRLCFPVTLEWLRQVGMGDVLQLVALVVTCCGWLVFAGMCFCVGRGGRRGVRAV
jgi:hypothetical protein